MSRIRYDDRLLLVGATGCGKSTVARAIASSVTGRLLIVDPADSALTEVPGHVTVRGPREPMADDDLRRELLRLLEPHVHTPIVRYVAGEPTRGQEYDVVYRWAFAARWPGWVWLDEAGIAAPAQGCPRGIDTYLIAGRKRQLGHLAAHTRPREISRNLPAQAQHVLVWNLPNPDDRDVMARTIGISPTDLRDLLDQLERVPGEDATATGFLWWSQRENSLTICPPPAA